MSPLSQTASSQQWRRVNVAVLCALSAGYIGVFLDGLGVPAGDTARYLLYLIVVTYAPGVALAVGVWQRRMGALRLICLGAGLGYVLEGYMFLALGALHARSLWTWYPVVGLAAIVWLAWQWHRNRLEPGLVVGDAPAAMWVKTAIIGLIVTVYGTYLAFLSSVSSHLALMPRGPDLFWHLGLAAEIKNHWPIRDPRLAGFDFAYHYLSHVHIAAASLGTGVELQVLLFRLYLVPLLVLAALNVCVITRLFTRSTLAQVLALLMVFFAGTLDLSFFSGKVLRQFWSGGPPVDLGDPWVFVGNSFFSGISPSLVYGLAIFLPLVSETLVAITKGLNSPRRLVVLSLLIAGSMLAKGSFMPVFVAGLMLIALWLWWIRNPRWRNASWLLLTSVVVCAPVYFLFLHGYWQGVSSPPAVDPFVIVRYTDLWTRLEPVMKSLWTSGAVKGAPDVTFRAIAALLACLVVLVYFVVSFGTRILGIGFFVRRGVRMSSSVIVMLGLILGSLAPTYLFSLVDDNELHFLNAAYPLSGILGAAGLGYILLRKRPSHLQRFTQVFAAMMILVSTWNSAYAFSVAYRNGHVADVVTTTPLVYAVSDSFTAQRWIRNHSAAGAVVAVNIFAEDDPQFQRRCDYSAFTERHLFLEGYHYQRGRDPRVLTERRQVLTAVVRNGDAQALEVLRTKYGVTHLVVDSSDTLPVKLPQTGLTLLFQTKTVSVYGLEGIQ